MHVAKRMLKKMQMLHDVAANLFRCLLLLAIVLLSWTDTF